MTRIAYFYSYATRQVFTTSGLAAARPIGKLQSPICYGKNSLFSYNCVTWVSKQRLIALRNRGMIDPEQIDEYIARDGYTALAKALTRMKPVQIIEEIKASGLRGRGGAGFPTGRKWELAWASKGRTKYIVCNADEGDPGAFMDRSIIESDPHSILEGMIIGAKAIGASHGYIYIRNEYPLARERLVKAIQQAREYGLLGEDIFGTGFNFDISIHRGAGAFVCGEETSLIASLEGRAPEPKVRPPFPVQSGVWNEPTNINNVETWANVPEIINRGGQNGSPVSALRPAKVQKSSLWWARSETQALLRCRWVLPCGRSSIRLLQNE